MFKAFSIAMVSLLMVSAAQGALITGVTIADVSSEIGAPFDRKAVHTVDGSGLNVNGPGTHTNTPDGNMWLNAGTGAFDNGTPDNDPTITFNLGSGNYVASMRVWNYNEAGGPPFTLRGVDTATLEYSTNDTLFTPMGTITFNQAPGTDTVDFSQLVPLGVTAQYIRLTNMTDFPGADNGFVGLSEVEFNSAPEPSSLVALAGIGAMGFVLVARRKRGDRRRGKATETI